MSTDTRGGWGVDLPVSYANVTSVGGDWESTWLLRGFCLVEAILGIAFNIMVLWISISRWSQLRSFKLFFTNLAITDLVYAFIELGCETHLIPDFEKMHIYMEGFLVPWSYYWGRVSFLWHYGGAVEVAVAPMWIFLNRYVVLCMPKGCEKQYFSTKKTILYFILGHLVCASTTLSIGYIDPGRIIYQQLRDEDWRYNYTQPLNRFGWYGFYYGFAIAACVCYPTSIWCTYKVHKKLNENQKAIAGALVRKKVLDDKAMLKTIVVQGLVPVFFFIPVLVTLTLFTVGGVLQIHNHLIVNWSVNLLKSNGAIDGFMTLFMMKAYRRVVFEYLAKLGVVKVNRTWPSNRTNGGTDTVGTSRN